MHVTLEKYKGFAFCLNLNLYFPNTMYSELKYRVIIITIILYALIFKKTQKLQLISFFFTKHSIHGISVENFIRNH